MAGGYASPSPIMNDSGKWTVCDEEALLGSKEEEETGKVQFLLTFTHNGRLAAGSCVSKHRGY